MKKIIFAIILALFPFASFASDYSVFEALPNYTLNLNGDVYTASLPRLNGFKQYDNTRSGLYQFYSNYGETSDFFVFNPSLVSNTGVTILSHIALRLVYSGIEHTIYAGDIRYIPCSTGNCDDVGNYGAIQFFWNGHYARDLVSGIDRNSPRKIPVNILFSYRQAVNSDIQNTTSPLLFLESHAPLFSSTGVLLGFSTSTDSDNMDDYSVVGQLLPMAGDDLSPSLVYPLINPKPFYVGTDISFSHIAFDFTPTFQNIPYGVLFPNYWSIINKYVREQFVIQANGGSVTSLNYTIGSSSGSGYGGGGSGTGANSGSYLSLIDNPAPVAPTCSFTDGFLGMSCLGEWISYGYDKTVYAINQLVNALISGFNYIIQSIADILKAIINLPKNALGGIFDIDFNFNGQTESCYNGTGGLVTFTGSLPFTQRLINIVSIVNPIAPAQDSTVCTLSSGNKVIHYARPLSSGPSTFDIIIILFCIFPILFASHHKTGSE